MGQRMNEGRNVRRVTVVAAALGLTVGGGVVGAVAAGQFEDVDPGYVHAPGISYVADAGITTGCQDGSVYCPTDVVTRAQMATFLHRLSGQAPGVGPTVDAATVRGLSPEDLRGETGPAGPEGDQGPRGEVGPAGPAGADGRSVEVLRDLDEETTEHPGSGTIVTNTLTLDLDDACGDGTTTHQVLLRSTAQALLNETTSGVTAFNVLREVGETDEGVLAPDQESVAITRVPADSVAALSNVRLLELAPGSTSVESAWAGNGGSSYDIVVPTLYASTYGYSCGG